MLEKSGLLKGFTLLLFALICQVSYGQNVGINATGAAPDASAGLDVSFTNKGFLVPRMLYADKIAISSPATGLLVYQTDQTAGFYYYNGTTWTLLNTGTLAGWSTTGNASTTAGTNFLGTTDAVDFVIKTNNVERARYLSSGYAGIGLTAPAAPLHVSSTSGNILYLQSTTGGSGTQASIAFKTYGGSANPTGLISAVDNNWSSYFAFFTKIPGADTNPLSERMRITTTGEVAIGTTTPDASAKLDISSSSQGLLIPRVTLSSTTDATTVPVRSNSLLVYNTASANDVTPGFYYWNSTLWTRLSTGGVAATSPWTISGNNIHNNNTGNVAVGTSTFAATNPYKFFVDAGTTTSYNLLGGKGSINSYLQLNLQNTSSGAAASSDIVASNNLGSETSNYVDLGINSSGNTTTDALGGGNNAYLYNRSGDFTIGTATADKNLRFITGGQAVSNIRMKVDSIGNVGIGTGNSDISESRLNINGGTITNNVNSGLGTVVWIEADRNQYIEMNIQNTNGGLDASADIVATANNGGDNFGYIDMGINSDGYRTSTQGSRILNGPNKAYLYAVGAEMYVGNAAANQPLIFFTNSGSQADEDAKGSERMRITDDGEVLIGTTSVTTGVKLEVNGNIKATNVAYSSDRRLKTNIESLNYGLNDILSLRPVKYNWIDPKQSSQKQIGLIAQEAKTVIPELVSGDESKETLSINYMELVPVLINAIKEQQKQIDELKQQVQKLQK